MSLDLTLIVDRSTSSVVLGRDQLTLDSNYELFAHISSFAAPWYGYPIKPLCHPRPIDRPVRRAGTIEPAWTDAYGELLTWISAGELAQIPRELVAGGAQWNQAIFAFLRALPSTTKIVLDWH